MRDKFLSKIRRMVELRESAYDPLYSNPIVEQYKNRYLPIESDLEAAEKGIEAIIRLCGGNPKAPDMIDTPARVIKAYLELTSGYEDSAADIMETSFDPEGSEGQVVYINDIDLTSLCRHHLLPFVGKVNIAYEVGDKMIGLSKFNRLARCIGRRFQTQEVLTKEIAQAVKDHTGSPMVRVNVTAEHMCVSLRGAEQKGTKTHTEVVL